MRYGITSLIDYMNYVMIQNMISGSGIFWSTLLIYAALTKSPKVMRPCVIIIVVKCTMDLLAAIVNHLVSERIVSTGKTIFIISEGPCHSYLLCFSGHLFFISILQQNLIWLICSYVFRYCILKYRDPTIKTFLTTALVAYIPLLCHASYWAGSYYFSEQNFEQRAPRVFSKPGDLGIAGSVIYNSSITLLVILILLSGLTLLFYLWISIVLWWFLRGNTSRLSKTAIILNTQLRKAIHFQAFIPIFILLGIYALYLMHYLYIDPYLIQMLPSIFLSLTLSIFPLSYIFFMPPYFNFCLGNPKRGVTRLIKSQLKMNSTIDVGQSSTVAYPLSTF